MKKEIEKIVNILCNGGVGVMPTDTIYGLVACAHNVQAVEKVYQLKGRASQRPFLVLVSCIAQIEEFGIVLTEKQKNILTKIWITEDEYYTKTIDLQSDIERDGRPISVVIPCSINKYKYIHRGQNSIGFRLVGQQEEICHSMYVHEILKKTGPIIATSANISGQPFARTIAQARMYFGDACDFYIRKTHKLHAQPSIVVSLSGERLTIVRA